MNNTRENFLENSFGKKETSGTSGWSHPYPRGNFSPFWYADGDDDGTDIDGDDDDGDQDDDDDDSDGGKDDDGTDDKFTPPSEVEWKKVQRKLKRANTQAQNLRTELDSKEKSGKEVDADTEKKFRDEGRSEAEKVWKPRFVKQAAKAAFSQAGAKSVDRLIRMLDLEEIDVDEDGDIDGLDEQIRDLKKEVPELFGPKVARNVDAGDKTKNGGGGGGKKSDSATAEALRRLGISS